MKYFGILLIVVVCSSFCMHPMHISFTKVAIENSKISVVMKVFPDDIALAIQSKNKTEKEKERLIIKYLQSCCTVKGSEKLIPLKYEKTSIQEGAVWYYFTGKISANMHAIHVNNQIMCNIFDDQKNLVIISYNSKEKGFTLDYKNRTCMFSW